MQRDGKSFCFFFFRKRRSSLPLPRRARTHAALAGGATADGGVRELAGLPEGDEGFQARDDAQEAGMDEQVQGGQQRTLEGEAIGLGLECGADESQLPGQGGLL